MEELKSDVETAFGAHMARARAFLALDFMKLKPILNVQGKMQFLLKEINKYELLSILFVLPYFSIEST